VTVSTRLVGIWVLVGDYYLWVVFGSVKNLRAKLNDDIRRKLCSSPLFFGKMNGAHYQTPLSNKTYVKWEACGPSRTLDLISW